jgi:hypothetical protein
MPDLIRHPGTEGFETALDSRLRGNDKNTTMLSFDNYDIASCAGVTGCRLSTQHLCMIDFIRSISQ